MNTWRARNLPVIALALARFALAADALEMKAWPLPGRNRVPADATLFLEFLDDVDTMCSVRICGETVHGKGNCQLLTPLPGRDSFIYLEFVEGRGFACVYQDPRRENGYEAVISVHDRGAGRGRQWVRVYHSPVRAEAPAFLDLIRIPDAPQPYFSADGQFLGPEAPAALPRSSYAPAGRFWGEQSGAVVALLDPLAPPAFRWQGRVEEYAVVAFDGTQVRLLDCGLSGSDTTTQEVTPCEGPIQDCYLVLSECTGPGRVRVVQPMDVGDAEPQFLIEIDDRGLDAGSYYSLAGCLIDRPTVDRFYGLEALGAAEPNDANDTEADVSTPMTAGRWASIAALARDEATRLWAVEKFCMLQPYPGPPPNAREQEMLNILQNQALAEDPALEDPTPVALEDQLLEVLLGRNMILAWPRDYTDHVPTKWRFLAELDVCMERLKTWTGRDEVRRRDKRMISRFRVDDGGTALYASFRLHVPRREMRIPPDHEPYSHEVSHGYVYFPAMAPTGQFAEGLTEVSRAGYWHFLGLEQASTAFRRTCLTQYMEHFCLGGTALDAPGYAGAASLYFVLMDHFCRAANNELDWHRVSDLFALAGQIDIDSDAGDVERWRTMASLCEEAFGEGARSVLMTLGIPVPAKPAQR